MRIIRPGPVALVLAIVGSTAPPALAQAPSPPASQALSDAQTEVARLQQELAAMREQYDARLHALEERLAALAAAAPAAPQQPAAAPPAGPPPPPEPPPPTTPVPGATSSNAKVFNPDIAVIGNLLGAAGHNPNSDQPTFGLDEVETSFQAIVDPYARADVFLSAGPDGLDIEEGFVTFNTLPAGLLLKAGKMRAQFGKVNTMHTHVLPWTDRPLVTENLVGGDEGVSESGLSVSRLIENPFMFVELTGETFYGASEVFQSNKRPDLVYVARARAYRDLTEGTNLDLGSSFAYGPSAIVPDLVTPEDTSTRLIGIDATFRYRPLRRAIYRRFIARSEFIWSQPRQSGVPGQTAFGMYASGDYQFARRWYAGARYDRSGRAWEASTTDTGGAFYLTYWPSEFNQVRGQYRRTHYGDGVHANEFLFQFLFSIGAHGAHVF